MTGINKICISAENLVCVCIDTCESGVEQGRLYHRFSKEKVPFHTMTEMLVQMDLLFDRINFPQAAMELRSFQHQKKSQETEYRARQPDGRMRGGGRLVEKENDNILKEKGDIATFVVHVRYRQNATWQGDVLWAEKNEKVSFRSALELIRLMDHAIEEGTQEG